MDTKASKKLSKECFDCVRCLNVHLVDAIQYISLLKTSIIELRRITYRFFI